MIKEIKFKWGASLLYEDNPKKDSGTQKDRLVGEGYVCFGCSEVITAEATIYGSDAFWCYDCGQEQRL